MNRKISTLPDVAVLGDLLGTQPMALDDLVATKTKQVTLALLRRALFAAGTGYTATDALQAGNTTITGTLAVSGAATIGGTLAVTGALTVGRIAGSSLALGTDASGTDAAATSVTQTAPLSTGNATPAALVWQVGVQGSSGSTPQTLTEGFRVQEIANATSREVAAWNPSGVVMAGLPTNTAAVWLRNGVSGRFGTVFHVVRASSSFAPSTVFIRGGGSFASPSDALSGYELLSFSAQAIVGSGTSIVEAATLNAVLRENAAVGTRGTAWRFSAASVGSSIVSSILDIRAGSTTIGELVSNLATLRLIPGATQFAIRDSGNTADTFTVNAAGTAITAPLATSFVVGTDPGGVEMARFGGSVRGGAYTSTSTTAFKRNINTSFSIIYGGDADTSANVRVFGISHATQANDIELRSGANVRGWWDDSAALWEFSNAASTLTRFSTPAAGQTSLWLYDADNATLERVTVGAADSGGVGYKVLRIPN